MKLKLLKKTGGLTMDLEEFKKLVEEKEIPQMIIELYLMEKGYVVLTESQYDNMEVIDQDGDVP